MKAIRDLRKLVSSSTTAKQGTVVGKTTTTLVVSSSEGKVELYVPNVSQFQVGTPVRYRDGVFLGFSSDPESLPVYQV